MTVKFDGVELSLQPTAIRWYPQEPLDISGDGHGVYPAVRQCHLRWGIMSMAEAGELFDKFDAQGSTGTIVVDLPQYWNSPWGFYSYSGCILREPQIGEFFTEHIKEVLLIVDNIRT